MADVELLPLPEHFAHQSERVQKHVRTYARANLAALQAEVEALRAEVAEWKRVAVVQAELHGEAEARAERLAKALALLPDDSDMVEHNPEEGPRMACCGREVQVQWHGSVRTHDEDCWYARMRALRDEDQENKA